MANCAKCGAELADNMEFCGQCGAPVAVKAASQSKRRRTAWTSRDKKVAAVMSIAVVIFVVVFSIIEAVTKGPVDKWCGALGDTIVADARMVNALGRGDAVHRSENEDLDRSIDSLRAADHAIKTSKDAELAAKSEGAEKILAAMTRLAKALENGTGGNAAFDNAESVVREVEGNNIAPKCPSKD